MALTTHDRTDRARRGWYLYGWASQTFPTVVTTVFMSRYLTSVAENAVGKHGRIHPFGIPVAPGSLFVYTVSAATVVLVVLMPMVGAIADRTGRKRDLMLGAGWFGALACVLMVFVHGTNWQLGAILYALAFLGYSCSIVVSYSLLVDLSTPAQRDRVSSLGWALAYIGGGTLLAVSFATSLFVDKTTLARRRCARRASGGSPGRCRCTGGCRESSAAGRARVPAACSVRVSGNCTRRCGTCAASL